MPGLYFIDGELIISTGDVRIYKMNDEYYLEKGPGHNFWADSLERTDYKQQIGNNAKGKCLEIGLGLGVASEYILSQDIETLTTVEFDLDVINAYRQLNPIPNPKHNIVCQSGYIYMSHTNKKYDFIFLDFYTLLDREILTQLQEYKNLAESLLNPGGVMKAWFDPYTPDTEAEIFYELFGEEYREFAK